jgi:NADH-quinone oxidoreductase subunit K
MGVSSNLIFFEFFFDKMFWEPLFWYQIDPLFYSVSLDFLKLYQLTVIGVLLLGISVFGIFFYSRILSLIQLLLLLELALLGFNLLAIAITFFFSNPLGLLLIYFFLTLAAAESALGLTLLILYYRLREDTLLTTFNRLFD